MADGLIARVKRLVSGNINNIVDVVENSSPETVMREAIREVERATDEVRHELGEVVASKHLASRRLLETNTKHEELTEKINVALAQSREDLAEVAIARQLDIESQIPVMESAINDASHEEAELNQYIAALRARKRDMEEELDVYLSAQKNSSIGAPSGEAISAANDIQGRVSNADTAFNRVMKNASGVGGASMPDPASSKKLAELEELARDNRVSERLAKFKANMQQDGG